MAGNTGPSQADQIAAQEKQRLENERLQKEAADRQAAVDSQNAQVSAIGKSNTSADTGVSTELNKKKKAQLLSTGLNTGSLLS